MSLYSKKQIDRLVEIKANKDQLNKNRKFLIKYHTTLMVIALVIGTLAGIADKSLLSWIIAMQIEFHVLGLFHSYHTFIENKKLKKKIKEANEQINVSENLENTVENSKTEEKEWEEEEYKILTDDKTLENSGKHLLRLFNGPAVNKNPLTAIPLPQMTLYRYDTIIFNTKEEFESYAKINNCDLNLVEILEYIGTFANRSDVIRVTYENNQSEYYSVVDKDGYGVYNSYRSIYQGKFVWEYNYGQIRYMYDAFRERGIEFENDIYQNIDNEDSEFMRLVKDRHQ